MHKALRLIVIAAAAFLTSALSAAEPALNIGWGRCSINPGKPVAITGQHYLRVSLGEFNPVVAEALVVENGRDAVIFVSVDMVGLRNHILDKVQEKLRAIDPAIPVDKIIMNATHTHAGPSFASGKPAAPGLTYMPTDEFIDFLTTRISGAVADAWKNRAPGSVAFGYGFATTGHSRRTVYLVSQRKPNADPGSDPNGMARMYGNTSEPAFSHYEAGLDSFLNLMYTFDAAGKLTGAVINTPCPAQTNEHAWMLHAGFWHPVRERLRAEHGNIGIIAQCAAAGDLSPRQMHYRKAELRRYRLKYPEKYREYKKNPLRYPRGFFVNAEEERAKQEGNLCDLLRAEDIASRIAAGFDEVLAWAGKDKLTNPVLRHEVAAVQLDRRLVTEKEYREFRRNIEKLMAEKSELEKAGKPLPRTFVSRLGRSRSIVKRYKAQQEDPTLETTVHAVRIGDFAFASNRFELFIDFMHRIQGRSPFTQTIIVQLTADPGTGGGSYLATKRAAANLGYSATLLSNQVSPKGGRQLVETTLEMLNKLKEEK